VKRELAALLIGIAALQGCSPSANPPAGDRAGALAPPAPAGGDAMKASGSADDSASAPVSTQSKEQGPWSPSDLVCTVDGQKITMADLQRPLLEGYGLNVMLNLVQLDLARQAAREKGIIVTPEDIKDELRQTLIALNKATMETDAQGRPTSGPSVENVDVNDPEQLKRLQQVLDQRRISRAEFDIVLETNAYLRKIAQPQVRDLITDDKLREFFNARYGEKAKVRYIVCANRQDVLAVQKLLAENKPFEQVAQEKSVDRQSASLGGELPAFTRQDQGLPTEFKEVAFTLKPGDVSDPVQIGTNYYIIKLEAKIPPQHAKFEDYKDSVRQELYEEAVQGAMAHFRQNLGSIALKKMEIQNPVLKKQFEERVNQTQGAIHDAEQMRQEMDRQRQRQNASGGAATQPATEPSSALPPLSPAPAPAPAAAPTTAPAAAP